LSSESRSGNHTVIGRLAHDFLTVNGAAKGLIPCIEEKMRLEMLQRVVLTMHTDLTGGWKKLELKISNENGWSGVILSAHEP
jgi:hypothetical protein